MGALTLSPLPSFPSLVVLLNVSSFSLAFSFSASLLYGVWSPHPLETHEWQASPLNNCVFQFWHGCTKQTHKDRHTHKNNMLRDSRLAFPHCLFLQSAMWTARLNVRERYLIPRAHTHAYSCTQKPYTDKTPSTDSVWSVRLNVRGWCKFTRLLPEVVHHNANAGQISVSLSSKNFCRARRCGSSESIRPCLWMWVALGYSIWNLLSLSSLWFIRADPISWEI